MALALGRLRPRSSRMRKHTAPRSDPEDLMRLLDREALKGGSPPERRHHNDAVPFLVGRHELSLSGHGPGMASAAPTGLVLPEPLEPLGRQLRVSHRVLDVPVAKVVLNSPSVLPVVVELEPAGVTQHVWVDGQTDLRLFAGTSDDLSHQGVGQRTLAFRREDVSRRWIVTLQAPQRS